MIKFTRELQVGILVLIGAGLIAYISLRVDDKPFAETQAKLYEIMIRDRLEND